MPRIRHADGRRCDSRQGGTTVDGFAVFNTVEEAVRKTGADATMIFVPPPGCGDAILEAADAGIRVIIAITEGTPVLDMARVKKALVGKKCRLIGPNCPGSSPPTSARSASCPATSTRREQRVW